MSASVVFTIWIAASEAGAASSTAMSAAAAEMLGASTSVRVETFPDEHPGEVRPPGAGERSAILSWDPGRHERARLVLCRATADCFERWVSFQDTDPEVERGRTLGFLAATVFLDATPDSGPPRKPPPPPAPVREFPRGEVTAAASASGPGDSTALGASLGADYAPGRALRLGVASELRFGELDRASASSRLASLVARATWVAFSPGRNTWLGLAVGVGAYQLSISHYSSDDRRPDRQGRLLLGGTVGALAALNLTAQSSLYLELDAEILSGKTTILVHQEERATWPISSPLGRLGLRAAF